MPIILSIQSAFDKEIPDNFGNAECWQERQLLIEINDFIIRCELWQLIIEYFLDNTLYLAEQENGIIIDWNFYRQSAPSDDKMLKESHQRIENNIGTKVKLMTGDRGFDSEKNR